MKKRILASAAALVLSGTALAGGMQLTSASAADCVAAWNSGSVYNGGMRTSSGGRNWTAKWWTQGEKPSAGGSGVWQDNGGCGGGGGGTQPPPPPGNNPPPPANCNHPNWQPGTTYKPGNIVKYTDGRFYVAVHENPGYDPVESNWFWDPTDCKGGNNPPPPGGNNPSPPPGNGRFVVSESQFNQMFPGRVAFYNYNGLVDALSAYSAFARTGTADQQRREAAAFLANIDHETGGLVHVKEINTANYPHYCDRSQSYGCPAGQSAYYGKGPIQLSWNFNYKAAGEAIGVDLLNNPYLVEQNSTIAWKTAIWFWMTQRGGASSPSHNQIMSGGFGGTIRSINSIECDGKVPAQVASRVEKFKKFSQVLNVDPGGNLYC